MPHYVGEVVRPRKPSVKTLYTGYNIYLWESDTEENVYHYCPVDFKTECVLDKENIKKLAIALSKFPERFSHGVRITFKCHNKFISGTKVCVYDIVDYLRANDGVMEDSAEWNYINKVLIGALDNQNFSLLNPTNKKNVGCIGKLTPIVNLSYQLAKLNNCEPQSVYIGI